MNDCAADGLPAARLCIQKRYKRRQKAKAINSRNVGKQDVPAVFCLPYDGGLYSFVSMSQTKDDQNREVKT